MTTMTTMTLAEFLLARITEDEQMAQAGDAADWFPNRRFDPYRVLAECDAKRRIVQLHQPDVDVCVPADPDDDAAFYAPWCPTLQLLALPYADHPDYRPEWRP